MDLDSTLRSLPGGSVTRDLIIAVVAWLITSFILAKVARFAWTRLKVGTLVGKASNWAARRMEERFLKALLFRQFLADRPVAAMAYLADQQTRIFTGWLISVALSLAGFAQMATGGKWRAVGLVFLTVAFISQVKASMAEARIRGFYKTVNRGEQARAGSTD